MAYFRGGGMPPMVEWTQMMEGNTAHYTYRRKHSNG